MNTSELARRDKFQFSMLLNDKRYRSYTFQFFALFILICAMAYLGKNLLENLAAAGLNISYSFLGEPSGYDINQRLIEYNSQSTHLRASIVSAQHSFCSVFGLYCSNLFWCDCWYFKAIKQLDCCQTDDDLC